MNTTKPMTINILKIEAIPRGDAIKITNPVSGLTGEIVVVVVKILMQVLSLHSYPCG